jgi:hypothetical protein
MLHRAIVGKEVAAIAAVLPFCASKALHTEM